MNPHTIPSPAPTAGPCGISLEYDPDYLLLMGRLVPRPEVQYGDFVGQPPAVDWADIERQARQLLARSQDIALLVCLCRCACRLRHAAGLAQALGALLAALRRWPDAVHPQIVVDGMRDPGVRANALAALADCDGLAGDVGDMLKSPAVGDSLLHLEQAAAALDGIDLCAREQLGDDAPSLMPLARLLVPFVVRAQVEPATRTPAPTAAVALSPESTWRRSRADMRAVLADARLWFETHEPSSPVPVLLRHAEGLIGQSFCQVVQAVPAELLQKWQAAATDSRQVTR